MTTLFMETPDATQAFEFYSSQTGTVTYDTTTPRKSGLASWKCGLFNGSSGVNSPSITNPRRVCAYFRIGVFPTGASAGLLALNSGYTVRITSGGVLQLFELLSKVGSDGQTLSVDTIYRISLVYDGSTAVKIFVDGTEDISETVGARTPSTVSAGWTNTPGSDTPVLNIQHLYADDITDLTDIGDVRVTAKLPTNTGGTNGWDGGTSPAVDDRPIDNSTFHQHGANTDVLEGSDIQAVGVGDVDITSETILGHTGWVWGKRGSGGAGSPAIVVNDAETAIVLGTSEAMFTDTNTSSSYPSSGTDEIGVRSTNASADSFWYEGGTMIAYIASAAGGIAVLRRRREEA